MERAIREVGGCQCMEHQAADQYRRIISGLNAQIEKLTEIIKYLADDLGYGGLSDDLEDPDGVSSLLVPVSGGSVLVSGQEDGQGRLNFGSDVAVRGEG